MFWTCITVYMHALEGLACARCARSTCACSRSQNHNIFFNESKSYVLGGTDLGQARILRVRTLSLQPVRSASTWAHTVQARLQQAKQVDQIMHMKYNVCSMEEYKNIAPGGTWLGRLTQVPAQQMVQPAFVN